LVINYHNLINREHKLFDNSTAMLLNLIKKLDFNNVYFAGFDGFSTEKADNFKDISFQNQRHAASEFDTVNRDLASIVCDFTDSIAGRSRITFITPSYYQKYINRNDIAFKIDIDEEAK